MDLYLIDGNSYVYRAFYAIKGLTDSRGRPTGAVFGFTKTLLKMINERKPDGLIVSFDTPHPTERHELFEDYKAHRPATPDELIEQAPFVREVLEAMRVSVFEAPGYEADDVIATLALRAVEMDMNVYIVSGDKDMLQLVDDRIKVYDPIKNVVLDEEHVREKFGVPPGRVTEYMALVGDSADNIPGVKGVGEKTAKRLLGQFKSVDELIAHPERIQNQRLRKTISEGIEDIKLSKRLAEINRDVPLQAEESDFRLKEPDWEALRAVFRDFEFTSLIGLLPEGPRAERHYETVLELERLVEIVKYIKEGFSINTEADEVGGLVGISLSWQSGKAAYVPLAHTYEGAPDQIEMKRVLGAVGRSIEDERISKTGHDLKRDLLVLRSEGITIKGKLHDTMLASYLINPLRAEYGLESLALEYLSIRKKSYKEVVGKRGFNEMELAVASDYASEKAELSLKLKDVLFERLKEEGLEGAYFDVEMPIVYVLTEMEEAGMKIDTERLNEISKELQGELESLQTRIFFLAGEEFNINSPKQLGAVLFDRLGLKPGKKKKTGYSTDVSVLEELARTHELPQEILNWRSISKLKNTYVDVLPRLVNPKTGRLHTSFNQTVTATGRLSSSEPNLQNIPVRGPWGRRIREAFTADKGNVIVSADYSQIELRILAHLSEDPVLLDAFRNDVDIHTRTASEIFGVPEAEVTPDMRRVAKTVNFGVIYGMTPFGLSEALGISRAEAERYISRYFQRHSGVQAYVEHLLEEAMELGFVKTLSGRKRPVPELRSRNSQTRQFGERLALNSPIQGSAADIIKLAMIDISGKLKGLGLRTKMVLQVHDELVFEAPLDELERVESLVIESMQGAMWLKAPLKVQIGSGKNWAEAH
jgi:DNA polymerase-1